MLPIDENKKHLVSRLFIYLLLGIAIFSTVYAAQKVLNPPIPIQSPKKLPSETVITPTPSLGDGEVVMAENADRCIVTIMDKRYDVTDFKSEHEGGDVFICGADMSKDYNKEHGKDLERAFPYEIDSEGKFINTNK